MIDEARLAELEALERAATRGPWRDEGAGIGHEPGKDPWHVVVIGLKDVGNGWMRHDALVLSNADAALIVALRNAAPEIFAELRTLEETKERFFVADRAHNRAMANVIRITAERDALRAERDKYRGLIHSEQLATMHYCETCELAYQSPEFSPDQDCIRCKANALEDERDKLQEATKHAYRSLFFIADLTVEDPVTYARSRALDCIELLNATLGEEAGR